MGEWVSLGVSVCCLFLFPPRYFSSERVWSERIEKRTGQCTSPPPPPPAPGSEALLLTLSGTQRSRRAARRAAPSAGPRGAFRGSLTCPRSLSPRSRGGEDRRNNQASKTFAAFFFDVRIGAVSKGRIKTSTSKPLLRFFRFRRRGFLKESMHDFPLILQ